MSYFETYCVSINGAALPKALQGRPGILVTNGEAEEGDVVAMIFCVPLTQARAILPEIEGEDGFPFVEIHLGPQGEFLLAASCTEESAKKKGLLPDPIGKAIEAVAARRRGQL